MKVSNVIPEHIESLTMKLEEIGVPIQIEDDYVIVSKSQNQFIPDKVKNAGSINPPYPWPSLPLGTCVNRKIEHGFR